MRHRQPPSPLPHLWLFTDERVAEEELLRAIARLPRGAGVVFRHYALHRVARRALFGRIAGLARRRGLLVLDAGEGSEPRADGIHFPARRAGRSASRGGGAAIRSSSAHNGPEIATANRAGVDLIFLSPVFPTRSHPGGRTLGLWRFATLARRARCPVIALGGMTEARFHRLHPLGAYGWAAIEALIAH